MDAGGGMEAHTNSPKKRIAWSLAEISESTGLSVGFLRNEQRAGRLPVKRFGRRVLVLDQDLQAYLSKGNQPSEAVQSAA